MKKLYSKLLTLVTIGFYSLSVWAQDAPVIQNYSDYTGDSFVANWDKVSGADKYFLNVYTNGTNVQNVNETFGNINHSDGKIDQQSPNYPNGWEINVSENGSTDMVVYEGVNKIILDATDDYISTEQIIGTGVGKYIVNANLINAENITQENSSLFKIEIFDKAGILLSTGTIETLLFAQITEFNIFDGFGYTQANIGRIKISIEKGDGKIGDLMINSISYSCTEPSYILKDQATAENSYPVTNLDPEKEYYYYVAASVEGKTTDASNIIRVNGFLTPKALDATGTSENSFTANWEKLPKAKGYIMQAYQYHTATQDSEKKILDDSFEKSTEGTMDDPISVTDPDLYTAVPGWSGKNILAANGMLGADNGRFPVSLSYLWTPTMNLSSNNGKYKIHIKARGTAGVKARVLTAIRMEPIGEFYTKWKAIEAMENGEVVIMSAGTGNPFFTTDTGSSLRGIEIEADVMLKGTRVDGIYTADPEKDPTATKFDEITYDEVLARGLKVMDLTATCMCKENNLPIIVFDMDTVGNLKKVMSGENIGTMVHN